MPGLAPGDGLARWRRRRRRGWDGAIAKVLTCSSKALLPLFISTEDKFHLPFTVLRVRRVCFIAATLPETNTLVLVSLLFGEQRFWSICFWPPRLLSLFTR